MLTGCSENGPSNYSAKVNYANGIKTYTITLTPIIPDALYYDSDTKIVYFWGGQMHSDLNDEGTTPTPYLSEFGNYCRYNSSTGEIEDIIK